MSWPLLTCSLVILVAPVLSQSQTSDCTGGRVYLTCGSPCPVTCDNRDNPSICLAVCQPGCFCPQGTVLDGEQCIDPSQCPGTATTIPPPTQTCINGKVFQTCGTACPRSCDNYQQAFLPCTRQCVRGCFCPAGMVEMGDRCVHPSECTVSTTPEPEEPDSLQVPAESRCVNGKIYDCDSACPLTCDNYHNPPTDCPLECCVCPHGMVETSDGWCVPPSACPAETTPVIINNFSPVLLVMKIRNIFHHQFMSQQDNILTIMKSLLSSHGYGDVQVDVQSAYQDQHLLVVIQLTGDGISSDQAHELASLFSNVSGAFGVDVVEVTVMDDEDVNSGELADIVVIGTSVGAAVVGLLLIVLLLVSVVCIVRQCARGRRQAKYREKMKLPMVEGDMTTMDNDFMKKKLVEESLSY